MEKVQIENFLDRNIDKLWKIIGNKITSKTFENVEFEEKLDLPDSIEYIEIDSFLNSNLNEVSIPKSIKYIEPFAFSNLENLEIVKINADLKFIQEGIFAKCKNLKTIKLPSSTKAIKNHSFYGCSSLLQIKLPQGLTEIGSHAFSNSGLKEIEIPGTVRKFGINVFGHAENLENVIINDGVKSINTNIFAGCSNLKNIRVPEDIILTRNIFGDCNQNVIINLGDKCTINKLAYQVLSVEYDGEVSKIIDFVKNHDMDKFNEYIKNEKDLPKFERIPKFSAILNSSKFKKTAKTEKKSKSKNKKSNNNQNNEENSIQIEESQILAKNDVLELHEKQEIAPKDEQLDVDTQTNNQIVEDNVSAQVEDNMPQDENIDESEIEELANQKFFEETREDREQIKIEMTKIKNSHLDDYDDYIAKLRDTEEYKQALIAWNEHYTKIKNQCKVQVENEIHTVAKNDAEQSISNSTNNNSNEFELIA